MLEPQEAADVYSELSKLARAQGLNWLLADVEGQIALGKQGTRDIEVTETALTLYPDTFPQRRGRKASFVVTQPLTEREKLLLLVEALEAVSVGLSLGVLNTYETISEVRHDLQAIGFAPDAESAPVMSVTTEILERKDTVLRLGSLFRELKDSV